MVALVFLLPLPCNLHCTSLGFGLFVSLCLIPLTCNLHCLSLGFGLLELGLLHLHHLHEHVHLGPEVGDLW